MARIALEKELDDQCLFHCQQALEKAMKATVIERRRSGRVRRTHDLPSLAEELGLELSDDEFRLLRRLTELYVPTRYGDEDVDLEDLPLPEWLQQTEDFFAWLRQRLA